MHVFLTEKKPAFQTAIEHLQKEFSALRTGRSSPALVENIPVHAYDSMMELKGISSITIPDAKTILIEPWDKTLLQTIEKAIRDSGIGLNPSIDGSLIRISIPSMTEETRKQIVKLLKEKVEEARIRIRAVREELRGEILQKEKDKLFSEDEKFKLLDELDKLTKEFNEEITAMAEHKEEEILTI